MIPPFPTVDHRIDPHPHLEERRTTRRSAPERLRFELPATTSALHSIAPVGRDNRAKALRVRLGRLLMAWGQRLAGPSQAP